MPIRMSGLISNLDTDSIIKELMKAQSTKKTKIQNKITKTEWTQEKWKELNTKIYSLYTGSISKLKTQGSYSTKKATSSNESKVSVSASMNAVNGSHSVKVNQLASAQYLTGNKVTAKDGTAVKGTTKLAELGGSNNSDSSIIGTVINFSTQDKSYSLTVTEETTVNDFVNAAKKAGITASFDTNQSRFFLSSSSSGIQNAFSITTSTTGENTTLATNSLSSLGLTTVNAVIDATNNEVIYDIADSSVSIIKAANSEIEYNGAKLTGTTNTITANGLTFNVHGVTQGETISLTVANDTQAVYDTIKQFIKDYNEVLKEMNTLYDAESAKGYDPLTDEEKEAMSEDQIEKWEKKIKDSLLRRDNTLSSLISSMKNTMMGSVSYNGKSYALSIFGIGTKDYTEKGLLHIDGDPDDSDTSINQDKLKKALEEDPEAVMKTLSTLVGNLYADLTDKMKSTTLSSALTLYNDKELDKNIKNYKSDLSDMEDRLKTLEDRYYKQFSAMEVAMAKLNSQTSALSSFMGTNY